MKSLILAVTSLGFSQAAAAPLPGTHELEAHGDLAAQMVEGIHRFFERETAHGAGTGGGAFTPEVGDFREWQAQRQPKAEELRRRLGLEPVAARSGWRREDACGHRWPDAASCGSSGR